MEPQQGPGASPDDRVTRALPYVVGVVMAFGLLIYSTRGGSGDGAASSQDTSSGAPRSAAAVTDATGPATSDTVVEVAPPALPPTTPAEGGTIGSDPVAATTVVAAAAPETVATVVETNLPPVVETAAAPVVETTAAPVPETAAPAAPAPEPSADELDAQLSAILRAAPVQFEKLASRVAAESRATLDQVVAVVQSAPSARFEVQGHTDSGGQPSFNQRLSQQRADAVRQYLIDHGVAADRLTSVGYGETRPVARNATPEGRSLNRRVEVVVIR